MTPEAKEFCEEFRVLCEKHGVRVRSRYDEILVEHLGIDLYEVRKERVYGYDYDTFDVFELKKE